MPEHAERITSPANARIKALVRLGKKTERDRTGLMLVEGAREIARALRGGVKIDEAFVCPQLAVGEDETALLGELRGLSLARLGQADVNEILKALPRVTINPTLTQAEADTIDPADMMEVASEFGDFFLTRRRLAELRTM